MNPYEHHVQIYYEDTDHSGVVYHANYLKYFERAREHMLGITELVRLFQEEAIGFVVYKADLTYKKGARFGDILHIRTQVQIHSPYRLLFRQTAHRPADNIDLVDANIQLACVKRDQLIKIPSSVLHKLNHLS